MSREVPEWIGKTDDSKVPGHVRLRIFRTHDGICHISRRRIRGGEPWDLDHIVALCNGGEHRESNLAPAVKDKHREKSAADVRERAETDGMSKAFLGIKSGPGFRGWRKMNGDIVWKARP